MLLLLLPYYFRVCSVVIGAYSVSKIGEQDSERERETGEGETERPYCVRQQNER